jgi:hypothetical protein
MGTLKLVETAAIVSAATSLDEVKKTLTKMQLESQKADNARTKIDHQVDMSKYGHIDMSDTYPTEENKKRWKEIRNSKKGGEVLTPIFGVLCLLSLVAGIPALLVLSIFRGDHSFVNNFMWSFGPSVLFFALVILGMFRK